MAAPAELRCQGLEAAAELLPPPPTATATPPPSEEPPEDDEPGGDSDRAELLGRQREQNFWTLEYYQAFFDVDTPQVLERIKGSVMPLPGQNFIRHRLRANPDLYGPFWICATLAIALAVTGNLSQLTVTPSHPRHRFSPSFRTVSAAATLVYCYAALVPLALWGFLRWRHDRGAGGYTLLETLCAYGYSLSAYVPVTALWLVPLPWAQWLALAVAALPSGWALARTFWAPLRAAGRGTALAGAAALLTLHLLLAVGCKLGFYQHPPSAQPAPWAPQTTVGAEGLHSRAPQPPSTNGSHPPTR